MRGDVEELSSLVLDSNGEGDFSVGAKLTVNANQAYGLYENIFDVQVNYQ